MYKSFMCLACGSHVVRRCEIALMLLNLLRSASLVCQFRTVFPIYVAEQPGQEHSLITKSLRSKSGISSFLDRKYETFLVW